MTVTNEATGGARKTDSTTSGDFNFPSLLPATYTVLVEKEGFQTFRSPGNILTPNGHLALGELRLSVGSMTQTVEVSEDLATWTPGLSYGAGLAPAGAALLTEISRTGTNLQTIVVRDQMPLGSAPARFLRVRVTAP